MRTSSSRGAATVLGIVLAAFAGGGLMPLPVQRSGSAPASTGAPALLKRFVVIAHRGNSEAQPENTLPAMLSAFALGADLVEVDVRLSRDGVPVLFHDATLDRTTNGRGDLSSLTLAQLKALDAGAWKGPQFAGVRIPTLAEALRAARGKGTLLLDVPVGNIGSQIAATLREVGAGRTDYVAGTWDPEQRADFVKHLPGAILLHSYDVPDTWTDSFFLSEKAAGVQVFEIPNSTPAFIAAARAHGMPVWAYTINDEPAMRQLIAAGALGIETDRPALAIAIARELGVRR
jgi:glycerophosphoryl diester phosphodiesterase